MSTSTLLSLYLSGGVTVAPTPVCKDALPSYKPIPGDIPHSISQLSDYERGVLKKARDRLHTISTKFGELSLAPGPPMLIRSQPPLALLPLDLRPQEDTPMRTPTPTPVSTTAPIPNVWELPLGQYFLHCAANALEASTVQQAVTLLDTTAWAQTHQRLVTDYAQKWTKYPLVLQCLSPGCVLDERAAVLADYTAHATDALGQPIDENTTLLLTLVPNPESSDTHTYMCSPELRLSLLTLYNWAQLPHSLRSLALEHMASKLMQNGLLSSHALMLQRWVREDVDATLAIETKVREYELLLQAVQHLWPRVTTNKGYSNAGDLISNSNSNS